MGRCGTYRCRDCGKEFRSREGGATAFSELRCVNCDQILKIMGKEHNLLTKHGLIEMARQRPSLRFLFTQEELDGGLPDLPEWSWPNCGAEVKDGLKPMCPLCRSRDTEMIQLFMNYD